MLDRRDHLGLLFAINLESSELWGNFSQTYSLVGLIDCETKLSAIWEDVL